MSKFGNNNGSNANGQPGNQTSLNGFRLDSTQSSWLMDRLNALSEEDKIAMMAAHAEMQTGEQQTGEHNNFVPPSDIDGSLPHQQNMTPENSVSPEIIAQQQDDQYSQDMNSGLEGDHFSSPIRESEEEVGAYQMAPDRDPNERDPIEQGGVDENAMLLKEKIESLEQQLAEISDLSLRQGGDTSTVAGDVNADHAYEEEAPHFESASEDPFGSQEPVTQGHMTQQEFVSHEQQAHSSHLADPHAQERVNPGRLPPQYTGYEGPGYGTEQEGGDHMMPSGMTAEAQAQAEAQAEHYRQGQQQSQMGSDGQLHMVPDYGTHQNEPDRMAGQVAGQLHDHHSVQQYVPGQPYPEGVPYGQLPQEGHRGYDHAELPQFLAPVPPQHSGTSRNMSIVGGLVALLIVGGVAYSYFDEKVSDVIKSEVKIAPQMKSEMALQKDLNDKYALQNGQGIKDNVVLSRAELAKDFEVSKLVGLAGADLPLAVKIPRVDSSSAFLVVRDLPKWASLNKGRFINGAWIVGVPDLDGLSLKVPDDRPGEFSFVVELVVHGSEEPVSRTVNAVIVADDKVVDTQRKAGEEELVVAPVNKTDDNSELIKPPAGRSNTKALIIDEALEDKWLERGTRLLRSGDFSAARLAFSHLAEQGSGRGALAMAMTFDPNQPSTRVVAGIKPDVSRAKFWYNRALSLGNEAAREPLRMLNK